MRGFKRSPWLFGLGVLLAIPVLFGGQAKADLHTDQGGSLIIFPKVVADGTRDTILKITNKSNMPAFLHCYHTNALGFCSSNVAESCLSDDDCEVTDDTCIQDWEAINFDIFLTAQQPTFWRASTGRLADLLFPACEMGEDCDCEVDGVSGALSCPGFDGAAAGGVGNIAIPGLGEDFFGEIRCFQTEDDMQTPFPANSIIGEAVLVTLASGEQSQYNAITIDGQTLMNGNGGDNGDLDLLLNRTNLGNGEYNSCPTSLVFTHYGEGSSELVSGAEVNTELTLVPCTALFAVGQPTFPSVHYFATDEFESTVSALLPPFGCFLNETLSDISTIFGESGFMKTRIRVNADNICLTGSNANETCDDDGDCPGAVTTEAGLLLGCRPSSGVVGVAEEFYTQGGRDTGSAAYSLINEGERGAPGDIWAIAPLN